VCLPAPTLVVQRVTRSCFHIFRFLRAYTGEPTVADLLVAYNEHATANGHVVVSARVLENILTSSLRMDVVAGGYRPRAARSADGPVLRGQAPAAVAAAAAPKPTTSPAAAGPSSARAPADASCVSPAASAAAASDGLDSGDDRLRVADVAADWLGTSPVIEAAPSPELPPAAWGAGSSSNTCGGSRGVATDEDEDCFVVGSKRTSAVLAHARYDCTECLLNEGCSDAEARLHCPQCWCAVCQFPAVQCTDWGRHCRTSAAQAKALAASARAATLQGRLRAVPCVRDPPAAGSPAAALLLDYRWLQVADHFVS